MNLCHFLFALLVLSVSADECEDLMKPMSLAEPSVMFGRFYTIMGYTDCEVFNAILNMTDSSWVEVTKSGEDDLVMMEANKLNGTCIRSNASVTVEEDQGTASLGNITTVFNLLPSCDSCLVFHGNSTVRNLDVITKAMNLDIDVSKEEFTCRSMYLMAKEKTLKDSDLEHFKQQASCFGFSGEPDYQHDHDKEFCGNDEGFFL